MIHDNDLTVVFGYSDNPERYSFKAANLLKEYNHAVFLFNPRIDEFNKIPKSFHTLTLYVNSEISNKFKSLIMDLNFKRIIFNPGTENELLENDLSHKRVEIVHGCTLVMLKTDQF